LISIENDLISRENINRENINRELVSAFVNQPSSTPTQFPLTYNDENINDENINRENVNRELISAFVNQPSSTLTYNDENINRENINRENVNRELISAFVNQPSSTPTQFPLTYNDENINDENINDENINDENINRENVNRELISAFVTQPLTYNEDIIRILQLQRNSNQSQNNDLVLPTALPLFDENDCEFTNVPQYLCCPITLCFIVDPIVCSDGYTYDRKSLENHLVSNNLSPMTREPLTFAIRNRAIRDAISNYIETHT
jgi:hypothetical protein